MNTRLLGSALLLTVITTAAAPAAHATPPPGSAESCTRSFESMTLEQILVQAERNGIPEADARAMFERVNMNEDDWICQKQLSGENHYNFVDN
jgi:hypothetical protein